MSLVGQLCMMHLRMLIPQLVVEVLADDLQDGRGDLRELDLTKLCLSKAPCRHPEKVGLCQERQYFPDQALQSPFLQAQPGAADQRVCQESQLLGVSNAVDG